MATNNTINVSAIGIQVLDSTGTMTGVTLTGTSNQISVSNGDGTAGDPTFSLTSTIQVSGISFDSGSNTLSNYSTGTFTPTISSSTPPTVGYTVQVGRYTRIGNRVMANISIEVNSYVAGTGNVNIMGLAVTSVNTASNNIRSPTSLQGITFGATPLWYNAQLGSNATLLVINASQTGTTVVTLASGDLSATTKIYTTILYEA